jgi:hypothetical protein
VYAGLSNFEKFTKIDENGNLQISEKRLGRPPANPKDN